jgi:uncharacterized membrane protein YebE (DUF533 family)
MIMNTEEKLNLLKQALTFASGILVARGLLTEGQAQSAINDIAVIVPALAGLGSIVWSVYSHWNMKKVPETATVIGDKK